MDDTVTVALMEELNKIMKDVTGLQKRINKICEEKNISGYKSVEEFGAFTEVTINLTDMILAGSNAFMKLNKMD